MNAPLVDVGPYAVSVAVVTHRARSGMLAAFERSWPDVRFTAHSGGAAVPSPDDALTGVLSAWRAVGTGATHHLVLQDDVSLCPGFLDQLATSLSADPGRTFSMFTEWGSKTAQVVRIAALTGAGWAGVGDPWLPAPAVVMPAATARGFAGYLAEQLSLGEKRDAFLLLSYLDTLGQQALISVPNLVEHDVPFRPSLLPNGKVRGPRRTGALAGARVPAWPAEIVPLPAELPYHSPHDLVASVLSDWDGDYGWTAVPVFEWLGARGLSEAVLSELFAEGVGLAGVTPDRCPVGYDSVRESWLSAFGVGWIIAETGRTLLGPAADPWQRELADTALRTMAAGPFRRVLAPALLDEWAAQAVPLLRVALEQGGAARHRSTWAGAAPAT